MKKKSQACNFIFIALWIFVLTNSGSAQTNRYIARGADTSEIYFSTYWYKVPTDLFGWGGIFRSQDNGQTLTLQHKYKWPTNRNDIFSDSMPGTIYLRFYAGFDTVMVSKDFGISYSYVLTGDNGYGQIASGCREGEFFLGNMSLPALHLIRYTDFGDSSTITNNSFDSLRLMDVGTLPGELYAFQWPYFMDTIGIAYSNDFGQNFSVFYQDTNIISNIYRYTLSRGTLPGELYLAGMDFDYSYHIFHSTDYGHTLELKHITEPYFPGVETVSFTAGRTPGSFYMLRVQGDSTYYANVWIYYSHDYGATFTTYYHSLDSTLTGINRYAEKKSIEIYPNPAYKRITIKLADNTSKGSIEMFDMLGRQRLAIPIIPDEEKTGIDISGLPEGVYYVRILSGKEIIGIRKIILSKPGTSW